MATTVVLLAMIFIFDYLPIIRDRKVKEILGYALLLLAGFGILFLHEAGVEVPSPPMFFDNAIRSMIGYSE